jgi:hypothetical protein
VTFLRLGPQLEGRIGWNTSRGAFQACLQNARSSFGILLLPDLMSQRYSMEHIHYDTTFTNTNSTPLHHAYTVSFVNQIAQWAAYAKPVIPVDVSRALAAIFIGINDISDSAKYAFPRNNVTNFPSFYAEIVGTEFKAIETIYEAGYRNYLFLNLPPLERTVCLFPSNSQHSKLTPTAWQRRTGRYAPSK